MAISARRTYIRYLQFVRVTWEGVISSKSGLTVLGYIWPSEVMIHFNGRCYCTRCCKGLITIGEILNSNGLQLRWWRVTRVTGLIVLLIIIKSHILINTNPTYWSIRSAGPNPIIFSSFCSARKSLHDEPIGVIIQLNLAKRSRA